jgi:hypothetical protein
LEIGTDGDERAPSVFVLGCEEGIEVRRKRERLEVSNW